MKKILIISLLVFIISMNCVSANDDLKETLEMSNNISEISTDDGSFTALQNKINSAESDSTISLDNDYAYNSGFSADGISITKSITINGNGHTINGLGKSRIFNVGQINLTLNNIDFINGYSDFGGAISSQGNLYINNCNFNNNVASGIGGGAIGSALYIKVTDSNFNNNDGDIKGGAISATHADILKCYFNNNDADNGGAVSFSGSLYKDLYSSTISDCSFNNNNGVFGGAISTFDNEKITNCDFKSNNAELGGAISVGKNCEIRSSEFRSNTAENFGGALYHALDESNYSAVYDSKFFTNHAENAGACYGMDSISGCEFENNEANYYDVGGQGGALLLVKKIINSIFINNKASKGGAVSKSSEIENCEFTNNEAYSGGAIDSSEKITNSKFSKNIAAEGSSIYINMTENDKYVAIIINNEFKSDKNQDFIYFSSSHDKGGLYLNNNTMAANNVYDIFIEGKGKIKFNVNLVFLNKTCVPNSKIKLCELQDDFGNTIAANVLIKAKLINNRDKSVKNIEIMPESDYSFIYDCRYGDEPLSGGVYNVTGTIDSESIENYKTRDGILIIDDSTDYLLTAQNLTKYVGGSEKLTASLVNSKGIVVSGVDIIFNINGVDYSRTTDSKGVASININLGAGNYKIKCSYGNSSCNASVQVISTLYGGDITKMFRNDTQYTILVLNSKGHIAKGNYVEFNINGVFYKRLINETGYAKLNINLNPGNYIITAKNLLNNEMSSNLIKVMPIIVDNNNLIKYYKNDSQYVIKLLDDSGNPVGAGENVTFNINGVFYTRLSNATGHAKLNINLNPGIYVITAIYKNLMVSNTITVKPILKAYDLVMSYKDGSKFNLTVLDAQGNPYPNQTITFNINGVFYNRISDENGVARLNINLMPGKYIITSMYENGAVTSNNVVINS